jgi:DNA polymerase-3 subunit delta
MKLAYQQLLQHLSKTLAPIYLISGDELLLVQEAVDAIRAAAIKAGYAERVTTTLESSQDWYPLIYTNTHNLSLFASKKIIEINLNHTKLTSTNGKIFEDFAHQSLADTLLLIYTTKLDSKIEKTSWYQAIEKAGVVLPVWPIPSEQLPQWIMQRAKKIGLQLTPQAADRLAVLVEGNLLAAAQEIEKLYLLFSDKALDHQTIENAVTDNARFDIFNLVDSALSGKTQRSLRILQNLAAEGIEPTLILWALTRELRVLADMQLQLRQGEALSSLFNKARVWEKRQMGFKAFLQRHSQHSCWNFLSLAAKIDRMIKGIEPGNVWDELKNLVAQMAEKASVCLL